MYMTNGISLGAGTFEADLAGPVAITAGIVKIFDKSTNSRTVNTSLKALTFHNPSGNDIFLGGVDVDGASNKFHKKLRPDEDWGLNITAEGAENLYTEGTDADVLVVGQWL